MTTVDGGRHDWLLHTYRNYLSIGLHVYPHVLQIQMAASECRRHSAS